MRPLILIAIFITYLAFFFSNNILPYTNLKFGALYQSVKEQKPEMIVKEGIFTNDISGYSIKVEEKSRTSNMMYNLMIYDHKDNRGNISVLVADSGTIVISDDKKYLTLTLFNGENYVDTDPNERGHEKRYPFRRERFKKEIINISLSGFDFNREKDDLFRNHYKMMNLSQIKHREDSLYIDYKLRIRRFVISMNYSTEVVRSIVNETQPNDSLKTKLAFVPDTIVNIDTLFVHTSDMAKKEIFLAAISEARNNSQTIAQQENSLSGYKREINKHTMERHKKFTWSFACLIFFFIGAPLGAIIRKGGLGMPVVASIVMFIAYYVVSASGEKFAREDAWDMFNGMWLSSFVFLPFGVFLTYKAATDSSIMNIETYQLMIKRLFNLSFLKKGKNNNGTNENSSTDK